MEKTPMVDNRCKEIQSLTDRELDAKVAEKLGWHHISIVTRDGPRYGYRPETPILNGGTIPNYTSDLNLCTQWEGRYTKKLAEYFTALTWIHLRHNRCDTGPYNSKDKLTATELGYLIATSSARVRCEAFMLCRDSVVPVQPPGETLPL